MVKCDICSGKIKDISNIDSKELKLCKICKEEEEFLEKWRCEIKRNNKVSKGVALYNNKLMNNDLVHNILVFL